MYKTNLLVFVIVIILFVSCTKEQFILNTEITIGDYSNMHVYHLDKELISDYNQLEVLNIDIDNDNINDIKLIHVFEKTDPFSVASLININCLHEKIMFLGYK